MLWTNKYAKSSTNTTFSLSNKIYVFFNNSLLSASLISVCVFLFVRQTIEDLSGDVVFCVYTMIYTPSRKETRSVIKQLLKPTGKHLKFNLCHT